MYDLSCLAGKQDRNPPNTCHFPHRDMPSIRPRGKTAVRPATVTTPATSAATTLPPETCPLRKEWVRRPGAAAAAAAAASHCLSSNTSHSKAPTGPCSIATAYFDSYICLGTNSTLQPRCNDVCSTHGKAHCCSYVGIALRQASTRMKPLSRMHTPRPLFCEPALQYYQAYQLFNFDTSV